MDGGETGMSEELDELCICINTLKYTCISLCMHVAYVTLMGKMDPAIQPLPSTSHSTSCV